MRKLIILIITLLSFSAQAQLITSPADLNMDSTEFAQTYGTVKEYNFQIGSISDRRPVLLTGTKASYVKEICTYLVSKGFGRSVEVDNGNDWIEYAVPITGVIEGNTTAVKIKAFVDPTTLRTNKVTITGRPDDMIALFVYYWPSDISLNQLKQGGYIYQDYASDRVAFTWKGKNPVITITPSPNIKLAFK